MPEKNGVLDIQGVTLTPLKVIEGELGNVYHAFKQSEDSNFSLGEAYFSTVRTGVIKGWKRHKRMVLNLVVPVGEIKFYIYDGNPDSSTYECLRSICLSVNNYYRLSVEPGLWIAFQGVSANLNMLLNLSSLEHDPDEAENRELIHSEMPKISK